jgi:hypothetical protein
MTVQEPLAFQTTLKDEQPRVTWKRHLDENLKNMYRIKSTTPEQKHEDPGGVGPGDWE